MLKIFIATDGSEHANRAMEAVEKMASSELDQDAVRLHVNPAPTGPVDASLIKQPIRGPVQADPGHRL